MEQNIIVNLCSKNGIVTSFNLKDKKSQKSKTSNMGEDRFYYDFGVINPKYNDILSIEQKRSICEMFTTRSCYYRTDYYINDEKRQRIWNSVVLLCPKCENRSVYRYLHPYDKLNLHEGDIIKLEHSLTTTTIGRKFTPKNNYIGKYIIRCKTKKLTRAHDVSVLHSMRCDSTYIGEKQVNFENDTYFRIDHVKIVYGKTYIYMQEI